MAKIILKVDDCWIGKMRTELSYRKFLLLCNSLDIKISLGMVGVSFESADKADIDFIRRLIERGTVHPYNHSYYHLIDRDRKEFFGTDRIYQEASIAKTNAIVYNNFGFQIETIGFPANACDITTIEILKNSDSIKRIYHVKEAYNNPDLNRLTGKKVLDINGYDVLEIINGRTMETGIINADIFFDRLEKNNLKDAKDDDVIVFQMHPAAFSDHDLGEFAKIILILKEAGNQFIAPKDL